MKNLVLAITFLAACAFAQQPAPAWLKQIKLSGLSGTTDHRLAVINDKTFSPGEDHDLKLKGKTVHVQCLEIREQSVLVRIEDLTSRFELTMSGDRIALDIAPVAVVPSPQPVASLESAPYLPPVRPLVPGALAPSPPPAGSGNSFFLITSLFVMAILVALVVGIAAGVGTKSELRRQLYRQNEGEAKLAATIHDHFQTQHILLNNVTLPTTDGTTQIDHILVTPAGIFVIETKHYTGWIFGAPQDSQWTQATYRKKSRFQNPLRQNYGHVKTLQSLFDLPENHFHSVVVFTADAEFKTDLGPNVVKLAGIIPFLTSERPVLFDEPKIAFVVGRIEMKRARRSLETDEYHINHLRGRFAGKGIGAKSQGAPSPFSAKATVQPHTSEDPNSRYMPKK